MLARLLFITLEMLLSEGHTDLGVKIETAKDIRGIQARVSRDDELLTCPVFDDLGSLIGGCC